MKNALSYFAAAGRFLLGAIWVTASLSKIGYGDFTIQGMKLDPQVVGLAGTLVIALEAAIGCSLFTNFGSKTASMLSTLLLIVFSIYHLWIGRSAKCNCFGLINRAWVFEDHAIFRNLLLGGLSLAVLLYLLCEQSNGIRAKVGETRMMPTPGGI
jgi:uncharacterized membrane protein YphA (DoxX/SURF4 family)